MAKRDSPRNKKSAFGKQSRAEQDFRKRKRIAPGAKRKKFDEQGSADDRERPERRSRGEDKPFSSENRSSSGRGSSSYSQAKRFNRKGDSDDKERPERRTRGEGKLFSRDARSSSGGRGGAYPKRAGGGRWAKNSSDEGRSSSRENSEENSSSRRKPGTGSASKSYTTRRSEKPSGGSKPPRGGSQSFNKRSDGGPRKSFVKSRTEKQRTQENPTPAVRSEDGLIRLNRFISNSGVCSRREADELIKMGLITVNGKTITEMGFKVKTTDDVRHEGKKLKAERPVYILLNKPKGYITTTEDPQERNTVMNLVANACKERIYPVGRLDRNTTGLLLLTNDGDLADKLTHPSYNAKKIYKVELDRPLTKNDFQKIADGITLEEGKALVDDMAIVSDDGKTVGIELHIGWNRIVRRIFESLDYNVEKLDRVVYAGLDKKDLKRGQWRFLKPEEIVRLKHFG